MWIDLLQLAMNMSCCWFLDFNLYHSMGIFSRQQTDNIFLTFPRKQDLIFHANCLHWRQFAWNIKSCFLGKIRKNISLCHLLKNLPRVLCVKQYSMLVIISETKTYENIQVRESHWHHLSTMIPMRSQNRSVIALDKVLFQLKSTDNFYFSMKRYIVCIHKKHLERFLMNTCTPNLF